MAFSDLVDVGRLSTFLGKLRDTFAPLSHTHAAGDIASGTLGVARGGTGKGTHASNAVLTGNGTSAVQNVATASGALYATAANGAAQFGTLPIAQGGTGATGAAAARTNLGIGSVQVNNVQLGGTGSGRQAVEGTMTGGNVCMMALKRGEMTMAIVLVDLWSANLAVWGTLPADLHFIRGAASGSSGSLTIQNNLTISGSAIAIDAVGLKFGEVTETSAAIAENFTRTQMDDFAPSSHEHAASDVSSGTLDSARLPTIGAAKGGTGRTTLTSNAVIAGNGTGQVKQIATASGALFATAANGAASFGTLPVAQGGTGSTSAADARTALGVTAANIGLGNVGDTLENVLEAVSLPTSNNSTILGSLSVPKGVWIIKGIVSFPANSTGDRKVYIGTGTALANTRNACNSAHAISTTQVVEEVSIVTLTSTKTYNLIAYQNSGSSLSVSGMITAVRIK